jgi:hypothetical protein
MYGLKVITHPPIWVVPEGKRKRVHEMMGAVGNGDSIWNLFFKK